MGYRHSRSRSEKCLLTHDLLWPCAFVLCGAHGRVWLCVIFCSRARRPAAFFHRWERGLSPLPSSSNLGGRGRAPPLRTQNKPPSSEGGVMTAGHDGGSDDRPLHFRSLPQSRSRSTAPRQRGPKIYPYLSKTQAMRPFNNIEKITHEETNLLAAAGAGDGGIAAAGQRFCRGRGL